MTTFGNLRKSFMGSLPKEAAAFKQGDTRAAQHLGKIFLTVIRFYHTSLQEGQFQMVVPQLNAVEPHLRGFAYEGMAMGLMQMDCVLPWKKRLPAFLSGPAAPYVYPAYIGAGLALARLGKQPDRFLGQLDPVLGWLLVDGYGFRHGIFSRRLSIEEKAIPEFITGYARRAFDQGLGRSIWFGTGANVNIIAAILSSFPSERQPDLWSGVGFACSYAGGAERAEIESLGIAAGQHRSKLAMGVAVAAKGRQRAGNLVDHADLACEVLCGMSSNMAAHITDLALQGLPMNEAEPAYEIWRQRIEAHLQTKTQETLLSTVSVA